MKIIPKTRIGQAAPVLIVVMFVLFVLGMGFFTNWYGSVEAGETILRDVVLRPGLALSMLAGFGAGIAAFVVGLVAIIKYKERAVLAFIATSLGALLTAFLMLEVFFSH